MRCRGFGCFWNLRAGRNYDWLRHAVVEGDDNVVASAVRTRDTKCPDDGGVGALQNAHDAALLAAIGFGTLNLDQDLIALHGGVDLVGRNKDVLLCNGYLQIRGGRPAIGTDKTVAIAVQI